MPAASDARGSARRDRFPFHDDAAGRTAAPRRSEYRLGEFSKPRPGEPGDAEHLAASQREVHVVAGDPATARFSDLHQWLALSTSATFDVRRDDSQRAARPSPSRPPEGLSSRDGAVRHDLAVAHHGQVVADLENLVQIVRDQDDARRRRRRAGGSAAAPPAPLHRSAKKSARRESGFWDRGSPP